MTCDCTLLINSCDAYEDIWPAFFALLQKNWTCPWPVVMNTETKDVCIDGLQVRTLNLYLDKPAPAWAGRLLDTLAAIDTEYVFVVLEDFFLTAPVDQAALDACLEAMRRNPDIAVFSFYPAPGDNIPSTEYPGYELRAQVAPFRFNCQAAIWRKARLESFLQPEESAWAWEQTGNLRSYDVPDAFYSVIDKKDSPFPYDPFEHGVYNGKWLESVPALFAANGIGMDFTRRGFFDEKQKALHPQVGIDFRTDAILYLNRGSGFGEADALFMPPCEPGTVLDHTFTVPAEGFIDRCIRIDPTSAGYCRFSALCIELRYTDGSKNRFAIGQFGTNGIVDTDGSLVFFCADPAVTLYTRRGKRLAQVHITGTAHPRLTEEIIDRVMHKTPAALPARLQKLTSYLPF